MERGPGIWKFNNSLLEDPNYVFLVSNQLGNDLNLVNVGNAGVAWDFIKYKIRRFSMNYSKSKAKERRFREEQLLHTISYLEQKFFVDPSPELSARLKEAQNELLHYYDFKLQGTIIRSRARWVEDGEKTPSIF